MRSRAFTLIELIVALSIGVAVLSAAVSIAVLAREQGMAVRRRAQLARAGAFLQQQLTADLRHAGLGVPTGPFHTGTLGGTAGRFNAIVLLGGDDFVGVVGDVPRPGAELPTFGSLASIPAGPRRFYWFTDNSGVCIPRLGGTGCQTAVESRLLPGIGGCDAIGAGADPTCPWGLGRLTANEPFVVVAGDGSWAIGRMPGRLGDALVSGPGDHLVFETASLPGEWDAARWPNTNPTVDAPAALRGQGFVASLDRLFYFRDGRTVKRIQCWGAPDPEHPGFPPGDALTMPPVDSLRYAPSSGGGPVTCTTPELVAHHVDDVRFSYLGDGGLPLPTPLDATAKRLVRGLRWRVAFKDDTGGRIVATDVVEGAVALRNLP